MHGRGPGRSPAPARPRAGDGEAATTDAAPARGLTSAEAAARLRRVGPNSLPEPAPRSAAARLLAQFRSPLIYVLLVALAVDLGIWASEGGGGFPVESVAIGAILTLNALLGVYQESKAEAALARLKALTAAQVWVLRDGRAVRAPAAGLVPGDLVRVEAGDRLPADGRLAEAQGALADESVLTGESAPVEKAAGDDAFSGTLLVRGSGYLDVTRTGPASAMGRIAALIGTIAAEKTPLERRLEVFGAQVARWVLALAAAIAVGGLIVEGPARLGHVLVFTVALAVSAVPEGLPAVLTLTLALGVERMARRRAVVRRLSAVEALGSVSVIATDKTGTLTENRMQVRALDSPDRDRALRAMALANDADAAAGAGDPLEVALLDHVRAEGLDPAEIAGAAPRLAVVPFDSAAGFMRVTVGEGGGRSSYFKGAPEVIFDRCALAAGERRDWEEKLEAYASEGYRILALAWREGDGEGPLGFLGLVLLWDPPRPEVAEAIRLAREAGIRVLMVTGDHPATALAVAREVGIEHGRVITGHELGRLAPGAAARAAAAADVYARVSPEQKLRLVEGLAALGEVVAVTGDGVNDAPALKRSDVGVAMGRRGSDVAREVSDLVLVDDNFATIVSAVEEGRNIYENIQSFVRFLFSTNLGETLVVVFGVLASVLLGLQDGTGGLLLPLTAAQLLWINVVTDGPPALALGLDRNPGVMRRRPRDRNARLLDRASLRFILAAGGLTALGGGALLVALPRAGYGPEATRTVVFLFTAMAQLVLVYPSRRAVTAPLPNPAVHATVVLGVGLQLLTVSAPALRAMLGLVAPDAAALGALGAAVLAVWGLAELFVLAGAPARRRGPALDAGREGRMTGAPGGAGAASCSRSAASRPPGGGPWC